MPIERKLAAIMFTDIAGYTESMSKSESKTLNLLEKKRSILKPLLKEYKGTFVKEIGDGTLSYFESAVNAATCAVKLQESTYDDKDMNIRVGIHIGDIVFKDGDVFGGGVNVASRLESIAPAGGVCVSKSVYDELSNQDDFDGIELGLQSLKGVGRLIEVYGLKGDKLNEPKPSDYEDNKIAVHSDDEVPSIAIIPFENKGADEDVFYAYGISVDLISDVSSAGLIRVASKKQIDEAGELSQEELANKLDVRYMANGELWRMGDEFQLSVELYDMKEKKVVWSDRWEENWDNLSIIKANLSDGLLKALSTKPKIKKIIETTNAQAYEYYLRGKYKFLKRERMEDTDISRMLLNKAIEIDNNFLSAKISLARTWLGWETNKKVNLDKALDIYNETLKQAEKINNKQMIAASFHGIGGFYYYKTFDKGENNLYLDKGLEYAIRSFAIFEEIDDKDGMGRALNGIGVFYFKKGEWYKALEYTNRALIINKQIDDRLGVSHNLNTIGMLYRDRGDLDKAIITISESIKIKEENNYKSGLKWSFMNMGHIHYDIGSYNEAMIYYNNSLEIFKKIGDKEEGLAFIYKCIAFIYFIKSDYLKAEENLEKSISIQNQTGLKELELPSTVLLYLIYNKLNKSFNINKIYAIIKEGIKYNIHDETNLRLYYLLRDSSYLETAYNQIQEKADNLEPDVKLKFLNYPIPKAIVEEWEKVNE